MKKKIQYLFCFLSSVISLFTATYCVSDDLSASDISLIKEYAIEGHPESQYDLGLAYEKGDGVAKNYVEAVKWYQKAAEGGEVLEAQINLANIYAKGQEGISKDLSKAAKWYEDAANQGDATSQYNLGVLYQFGSGVPRSYEKAAILYQESSDQGLGEAYINLARLYYSDSGLGVKQNYDRAAKLYYKAAAQKIAQACFELGQLHENPQAGWYYAKTKSMGWYEEAARLGHPKGKENSVRVRKMVIANLEQMADDFNRDRGRSAQRTLASNPSMMNGSVLAASGLILLAMHEKEYIRTKPTRSYENTESSTFIGSINDRVMKKSATAAVKPVVKKSTPKPAPKNKILPLKKLENPDGLYRVNSNGIAQLRVKEKDKNGNYFVYFYVVTNKESALRSGNLGMGGWWYPSVQQFHSQKYMAFPKRTDCQGWWKESETWSYVVSSEIKINIGNGRTCSGFRSTGTAPSKRRPKQTECAKVTVQGVDCNIRCTKWRDIKQNPTTYFVRTRSDAFNLYEYLRPY